MVERQTRENSRLKSADMRRPSLGQGYIGKVIAGMVGAGVGTRRVPELAGARVRYSGGGSDQTGRLEGAGLEEKAQAAALSAVRRSYLMRSSSRDSRHSGFSGMHATGHS